MSSLPGSATLVVSIALQRMMCHKSMQALMDFLKGPHLAAVIGTVADSHLSELMSAPSRPLRGRGNLPRWPAEGRIRCGGTPQGRAQGRARGGRAQVERLILILIILLVLVLVEQQQQLERAARVAHAVRT